MTRDALKCIQNRAAQIPDGRMRRTYLRAMASKSRKLREKAMCEACFGWEIHENEECTDPACPLWANSRFGGRGTVDFKGFQPVGTHGSGKPKSRIRAGKTKTTPELF